MWKASQGVVVGLLLGMAMAAPSTEAIRLPRPPTITAWNESSIAQLNAYLQALWNLTNGRYTIDVVTSNPNGTRVGTQGDVVLFNSSGTWKLCANTSATTAASPTGTTWRCSANALSTP